MEIVNAHRIARDVVAEVVGLAVDVPGLEATARGPDREAPRVMIAAEARGLDFALAVARASEFTAPDHDRVIEQPALLEILHERRRALVHFLCPPRQCSGQAVVVIPVAVIELDETRAALGEPARDDAVCGEVRRAPFRAVKIKRGIRFLRQVHEFRHARLHAERQLVVFDLRGDGGIAERAELHAVEFVHCINRVASRAGAEARRIREVEHGVAGAAEGDRTVLRGQEAAAPVSRLQRLPASAALHADIRGQVRIFAAESVAGPRAHRGPAGLLVAGAEKCDGRIVVDRLGEHRADECRVVGDARDIRHEFAHVHSAAAMLRKFVRRADAE